MMIKRALPAVFGFLSLCLPLVAQTEEEAIMLKQLRNTSALDAASAMTLYQPDIYSTVDSSILIRDLSMPTLVDGRRFPVSGELARMGMTPVDLFPVAFVSAVPAPEANAAATNDKDSPGELESLRLKRSLYTSGEMGVFYGTTTGKFGYQTKQSYIQGTIGNDKFQITAGVSSEESSWRLPRH